MTQTTKTLIAFSTSWGTKFGGINSFNQDLLCAFAGVTFQQAQTICIVLDANQADIDLAAGEQVKLVSIRCPHEKTFFPALEAAAWEAMKTAGIVLDPSETVWLGHDRITGEVALAAAEKHGGRAVLLHHMSYEHYEAYAENSTLAKTKEDDQKRLFKKADIALAIGPLLRDALADMLDRESVPMLVPGLPDITAKNTPKTFKGFLSGRLSDDAKKIKQAHLGVAAFAGAIRQADANSGLPDTLRGNQEPKLTLRGVDFENSDGGDAAQAEQELKLFAERHAGRAFALHALPFTTDREALFDDLRSASVAMMPSWHEGFGLVAWEAIAAAVPLIVSEKSGVYHLLEELDNGLYTSMVTSIDVSGSNQEPYFQQDDLSRLAQAIIEVAKDPAAFRKKAAQLREALAKRYSWAECARQLADALGWETAEAGPDLVSRVNSPVERPASSPAPVELLELPRSSWQPNTGLSDSQLLRAEEAIVPFDPKREPFLDEQMDWARAADYPIAVRLLTGVGGIGKTRLALELCYRLKTAGWQVGFLRGDYDPGQAAELGRKIAKTNQDCCVVLDYAETRQPVLLALLKALLAAQPQRAVRVLLLARDGGEWWNLLPSKDATCEALLDGTASSGPFPLPQLHDSEPDRQQAYQLALWTFAVCLQLSPPDHAPHLSEAHFGHPLYIQMAALIALRGERPKSAEALTRTLVNHERRYWRQALTGLAIGADAIEQQAALLMALATLANGIATVREIEKIWQTAGGDKSLLKLLFAALAPLYPGRQGLEGWRPDLLGEALIAQVMLTAAGPDLLAAVLGQNNQRLRLSSLTVLARLLRNRADLAQIIEDALVGHFVSCIDDLVAVCIETPSPLPQIAERTFLRMSRSAQRQAAGVLERHFEFDILPLTGLNVLVAQVLVDMAEKALRKQTLETKAEYGKTLANLSIALYRDGRNEAALPVAKQALDIYQGLAEAKPGRFEPDLAKSLGNYANRLSVQGNTDEALAAAKQGVDIYQRLAKAKPGRFEPNLAASLNNYANHLVKQSRTEEAIDVAWRALGIYQRMAEAKPERFEPDLAGSLNNYANHLAEQGRFEAALSAAKQALDIRQRLAQAKPDRFEPDLAASFSNYANFLADLGQWTNGAEAADQAGLLYQRCAARNPKRYLDDQESSRLAQAFWCWVATGEATPDMESKPMPELANPRDRLTLAFQRAYILAYTEQTTAAVECALSCWNALDRAQQSSWKEAYLSLAALAGHLLGPAAAPADWREQLARYRGQMQGRLPCWMTEAARRAGFEL